MTSPDLPHPATPTEIYLAAVLGELQAIRGQLARPATSEHSTAPDPSPPGAVELTEPAQPGSRPARTSGTAGRRARTKE